MGRDVISETIHVSPGGKGDIDIAELVPRDMAQEISSNNQSIIPEIAKDERVIKGIEASAKMLPTEHKLFLHDSRNVHFLPDESVHLIVTSPPYWNLKTYPDNPAQMGHIHDYEVFIEELNKVWSHCYRLLIPGGRLVVVVGDVCVPRRKFGRHVVFPLHSSIQESCREIGFDNLAPIIWYKIANAVFEASGNGSFLGKPYEPNAIIKNDIEYILFQRKPGGYRKVTAEARYLSILSKKYYADCFQQIWTLGGSSTKNHPAPFSDKIAERLIRMFSFVGDTIFDPFLGTGTTSYSAAQWGRNSIGVEVESRYFQMAVDRMKKMSNDISYERSLLSV